MPPQKDWTEKDIDFITTVQTYHLQNVLGIKRSKRIQAWHEISVKLNVPGMLIISYLFASMLWAQITSSRFRKLNILFVTEFNKFCGMHTYDTRGRLRYNRLSQDHVKYVGRCWYRFFLNRIVFFKYPYTYMSRRPSIWLQNIPIEKSLYCLL